MREAASRAVQSAHVFDFISHSPMQTMRIGQRLGGMLSQGDLLLLLGDLGSGKTQFAKGVALGLGSDDLVNSPSFVLVNEYRAGAERQHMPIYHADLYRLEDGREALGLGLEEWASGDGVCLIEWAERAAEQLPHEHLAVYFSYLAETKRVLRFIPHGSRYERMVAELRRGSRE